MNDHYVYLCVDLCCLIVPLIASFHPSIQFYRLWKTALPVTLCVAALFIGWDAAFTAHKVWEFNDRYVLGYYFIGLPMEEVLFFICIPYACMFTFYCFDKLLPKPSNARYYYLFTWVFALSLLLIGVTHLRQWYTSSTFLLLSILLVLVVLIRREFLPVFYWSFLANMIPFFISNGILTGTGLDEPVVVYSSQHNLNIRLLTIPIEDVFYGMLLQLGNVYLFKFFTTRPAFTSNKDISSK